MIAISNQSDNNSSNNSNPENVLSDTGLWTEIASLSDYVTQYGLSQMSYELTSKRLDRLIRNPYSHIKSVRWASKQMTTKHGVIKEVLRAMQTLPTLNFHLSWSNYDNTKKIKRYEEKIYKFLDLIDVRKFVRDGIYETGEMGTVVCVLRGSSETKKYIQFLDLDDLRIIKMVNGKWLVEFDQVRIKDRPEYKIMNLQQVIEALPDEVTTKTYNLFMTKGEDYRYVPLNNCEVISIDNPRNVPFGLPYCLGGWNSILQKEMIDRLERSQANNIIKKILIMMFKSIEGKPPNKDMVKKYFDSIKKVINKKDSGHNSDVYEELVGTGLVSLPEWIELKELDVTAEIFPKHLYDKIESDIYANLGVSQAMISGAGGTFSAAQVNSSKFFRYIFTLLEKFERVINDYIKTLLPADLSCTFYFERTTINDRKDYVAQCKELYQQTGVAQYWAEAITGVPYHHLLAQARYEKEVLQTDKYLYPPLNAFTTSGQDLKQGGRQQVDNPSDNTETTRTNGGNDNPSPSRQ